MIPNQTALERAFELARSGKFKTVSELKTAIGKEGYLVSQLDGPMLQRQLRVVLKNGA